MRHMAWSIFLSLAVTPAESAKEDPPDAHLCKRAFTRPDSHKASAPLQVLNQGFYKVHEFSRHSFPLVIPTHVHHLVCIMLLPLRSGGTGCGRAARRTDVQQGEWGCGRMSSPVRRELLVQPAGEHWGENLRTGSLGGITLWAQCQPLFWVSPRRPPEAF